MLEPAAWSCPAGVCCLGRAPALASLAAPLPAVSDWSVTWGLVNSLQVSCATKADLRCANKRQTLRHFIKLN